MFHWQQLHLAHGLKDITLDKKLEGPDHTASLISSELKLLINGIKEIQLSLGKINTNKILFKRDDKQREFK